MNQNNAVNYLAAIRELVQYGINTIADGDPKYTQGFLRATLADLKVQIDDLEGILNQRV